MRKALQDPAGPCRTLQDTAGHCRALQDTARARRVSGRATAQDFTGYPTSPKLLHANHTPSAHT
eukprot:11953499-Alexandrium_andersonii.AAC.1